MSEITTAFRRFATGADTGRFARLLLVILLPISLCYRLLVALRNTMYDHGLLTAVDSGLRVISVGNIVAGGTGKTPIVDYIVKYLVGRGCRVGIVSRGYGGAFKGEAALVSDDRQLLLDAEMAGDEPTLLARRNPGVPVVIAPKRIAGVRLLAERCRVDTAVLDDAFQHRGIARDLDIVLLDGRRPTGNGHLLPAGLLRESPAALHRADLAILTRCEPDCISGRELPVPAMTSHHQLASIASGLNGESLPLDAMQGKKVFAFAGIADPESFFNALRSAGVTLSGTFAFADHVVYSSARLKTLVAAAGAADLLLTTEKDAVKLNPDRLPIPCYSVGVDPVFEDPAPLLHLLDRLIAKEKTDA